MAKHAPEKINFPEMEVEILGLWKEIDAFSNQLKQSKGKPRYTFYDGPPFATGLPHYGHILAGTIKDIVTRWAHGSGYHVERRFGWDCHGLPVEYEIDKQLGIKGPEDVEKMGIKAYNDACRKIVMRYSEEWEEQVTRFGRWIDFKNDYKTMYPWFMESVWWVFKTMWDKGLVYRGFKVMPFSTGCSTPLSNFEAGQNYKDVVDPAVFVSCPLISDSTVSLVAWTTTPWTLPSNLALCVHPEKIYAKILDKQKNQKLILMEARLSALYKCEDEYDILEKFPGEKLKGLVYKPFFNYFEHMRKERGAFRVLTDRYVTEESGTGVVHQAPYFGEDDYRISLAAGIITRDMQMICPVDATGRFTDEVTHFKGQYVKDADKEIVKHLKAAGRMVHVSTCKHSYPFCWRSDTPLLYKAVPSWFVRVEQMVELLLKNNKSTYWVPEFVRDKRFANWLADARDWAISRNRYWGNPIPIWMSDDGEEMVCVGSIEELEKLSGVRLDDLHREFVDPVTIPSRRPGHPPLRRISEVFDCWFESGSMPYAQQHYPFEHKKDFEDNFPADFIAEGVDQTRGWFYTLLVVSSATFGKAPFKNLIVNGLVLAEDGTKMSKRKKNYTDPRIIMKNFGADALRLYLINSPVVRAETLKFKDDGVKDVVKDVFLPWYNAYRFLVQNLIEHRDSGVELRFPEKSDFKPTNYMDIWILSFTESLIKFVRTEMAAYRLYTVVPRLVKFVDQLTNWFVRMNRKRLKGDSGVAERSQALQTLFEVLFSMIKVMAPFVPFLTEYMYQNLRHFLERSEDQKAADVRSVHYLMQPQPRESVIETEVESSVACMQTVIDVGRIVRDRATMPVKYPLRELVVIHRDPEQLKSVELLQDYILQELNVRSLKCTTDKSRYGVELCAEPDYRALGARLRGKLQKVTAEIQALKQQQLQVLLKTGSLEVCGETLSSDDIRLTFRVPENMGNYLAHSSGDMLVLLDVTPDQSMLDEGLAREVVNRIQKLRRKLKLLPTDDITIYVETSDSLASLLQRHAEFVYSSVKQPLLTQAPPKSSPNTVGSEEAKVKQDVLLITLLRGHVADQTSADCGGPVAPWLNVHHEGRSATVLLANPADAPPITTQQLASQVSALFNLETVTLSRDANGKDIISVSSLESSSLLAGSNVYVI